jgi:Tfp pilus assembly protein PilF
VLDQGPDDWNVFKVEVGKILASEPNHADAVHLLGVIAHQFGRHELAVELIRQAIQQNGKPDYFFSLGNVFHSHGKLDETVAAYRQAITR